MRTYAQIAPTFWTRGSGKKLRGDPVAQVLVLYLLSAPASNMIGLYYQPLSTIAHETGLSVEQIRSSLTKVTEIARYDEEHEIVWIPEAARYQVGETLAPKDKKRNAITRDVAMLGAHPFATEFLSRYGGAYGLSVAAGKGHPAEQEPPFPAPAPAPVLVPAPEQPAPPRRHPDASPTNLTQALEIPIADRARLVLENPGNGMWSLPGSWPELCAVAEAFCSALGLETTPLGHTQRDRGVWAILELFRDGFTQAQLVGAAKAAKADPWFAADPRRRRLSALSPEVIRSLLQASTGNQGAADAERRRQEELERDQAARGAAALKRLNDRGITRDMAGVRGGIG